MGCLAFELYGGDFRVHFIYCDYYRNVHFNDLVI